ncbi:MAG: hypothetical protein NWE89_02345 [Candidatus Bathyarchaeota archaeon]|nr:hypothetical protein [Candidatus Bathyarchaeota archaeon]
MSDLSNDYIERYKLRFHEEFHEDLDFSKRFTPIIKKILNKTTLPKKIQDNVGTENDLKGHDLTIKLQIGVRTRRYDNSRTRSPNEKYICYVNYDEFTEDDKERDTMEDDVYFFGYSLPDESGLYSYIIFDHHDFRKARENNLLRTTRKQNKGHGLGWFTGYPIWDIIKYCKIYGKDGRIGWKKHRRYTQPSAVSRTLDNFIHRARVEDEADG